MTASTSRLVRLGTTLRTNWKKSVFLSLAGGYVAHLAHRNRLETQLMTRLCQEAREFGRCVQPVSAPMYDVTVILNPAASGGGARKKYESYCAPILHLAGIKVSVIRTEGVGQAKEIMEIMKDADAVLIAGGDGTVMEAVTGFMRRPDRAQLRKTLPLGVLPLGTNNHLAQSLFPTAAEEGDVSLMAHAAMACVKKLYRPMDVMQVENLSTGQEYSGKKLFGMSDLQIGAFRDAHQRLDKYWYWASLKKYTAYFFNYTTSASKVIWECVGHVDYATGIHEEVEEASAPSPETEPARRWWHSILPLGPGVRSHSTRSETQDTVAYDWAGRAEEFRGCEISIVSPNLKPLGNKKVEPRSLELFLGPESIGMGDFIREGSRRETTTGSLALPGADKIHNGDAAEGSDSALWTKIPTQAVKFLPGEIFNGSEEEDTEHFFNLDNERIEIAGPIQISLLLDRLIMFCGPETRLDPDFLNDPNAQNDPNLSWWKKSRTLTSQQTMKTNF